ncbi:MAG: bifunctional aspartate kinase/diaminopimelate decarboxylase [Pseudomonadota bacterium]|nr:bifunctional aspartate kinase/diaminopimelate decarboxylase [Pseudomonadota bacterium]
MRTIVLKFGGTSVATASSWQMISEIIAERIASYERVVVVVSALSQVSNKLEQLLRFAPLPKTDSANELFDDLIAQHLRLATELGIEDKDFINTHFDQLRQLFETVDNVVAPMLWAQVMSYGEIISSWLGVRFLQKFNATWIAAANLLLAQEDNPLNTPCIYRPQAKERALLGAGGLLITQGFIARNHADQIVLLGRGGSDTSATLLAAGMSAVRCELWSDVPGFYTADPRQISEAKLIKDLHYKEAQELALMGAKVLHHRAIAPLIKQSIPLSMHSTLDRHAKGTEISSAPKTTTARIKAITVKKHVMLLHMESIKMWRQSGFLADIFTCFKQNNFSVDLISTSEASVCVSLDNIAAEREYELSNLMHDLQKFCRVKKTTQCATISLIGTNIRNALYTLGEVFNLFDNYPVNLVTQSANDLNLTFVVPLEYCHRLLHKIHQILFSDTHGDAVFGDSWLNLQEQKQTHHWWHDRCKDLLALIDADTPALYVYDLSVVATAVQNLRRLTAVDRIFYAVKANHNAQLLTHLHQAGIGFECVSVGELQHVAKSVPQLRAQQVLFTPNFCEAEEYQYALARDYLLTVDNLYVLRQWGHIFAGKEIILRIDPGHSRGHHKHVMTGGTYSKFGIAPADCEQAAAVAKQHDIKITGLHAHAGSGILTAHDWCWRAERLVALRALFPQLKFLNLGGGFGIPEHRHDQALDMEEVSVSLAKFKQQHPQYELWIEPGRYLVAAAGVLLARVNQLKHKHGITFVGISTGMNSLLRPALYDSHHEIVNLTAWHTGKQEQELVEVVGPICESGDKLGRGRKLAKVSANDVLLIANTGAYGAVMSSSYNMRPPAGECVLV